MADGEPVHCGPLVAKDGKCPVCQWQGTKGCCPNDARFTCGQFAMTDPVWAFGQRHEMELGWGQRQ